MNTNSTTPRPCAGCNREIEIVRLLRETLVGEGVPGVVWYARGGDLGRSGPYATPKQAAEMFRLRATGLPPDDFCFWPEAERADP